MKKNGEVFIQIKRELEKMGAVSGMYVGVISGIYVNNGEIWYNIEDRDHAYNCAMKTRSLFGNLIKKSIYLTKRATLIYGC